jgi:Listeria/Bacterioides repeat
MKKKSICCKITVALLTLILLCTLLPSIALASPNDTFLFDTNKAGNRYQNITITLDSLTGPVTKVLLDSTELTAGTDYTVSDKTFTLLKETLDKYAVAPHTVSFFVSETEQYSFSLYYMNSNISSGTVLFDQFALITNPGEGAYGADNSVAPSDSYGYGAQFIDAAGNSVADDFILPSDATITQMTFFAYQTNSSTASTIQALHVRIYDGNPMTGGTVIWGNLTDNVLNQTGWTGIYRGTTTSVPDTFRPIMYVTAAIPNLQLNAGTYWVEYQMVGLDSLPGPWTPQQVGAQTPGNLNAIQYYNSVWNVLSGTTDHPIMDFALRVSGVPLFCANFDVNGHGSAPAAITDIPSGQTITAPADPAEDGYQFGGWFKEPECVHAWNFATDTVAADITLYAKWIPIYTVQIPFTINVQQADGASFLPETLTLEPFDFTEAVPYTLTGNTVTVNGAGSYNGVLTLTISGDDALRKLASGFSLRQVPGNSSGWNYSEETWLVSPVLAEGSAGEKLSVTKTDLFAVVDGNAQTTAAVTATFSNHIEKPALVSSDSASSRPASSDSAGTPDTGSSASPFLWALPALTFFCGAAMLCIRRRQRSDE